MSGPWQIWLHPRRSARELEEQRGELAEFAESLARAERELIACRERERELQQRVGELEEQLKCQRKDREEESRQWQEIERGIKEIEERLSEAEVMKSRYERRIRNLTMRLRDNAGMAKRDDDDDSELIDMTDTGAQRRIIPGTKEPASGRGGKEGKGGADPMLNKSPQRDDSDWLRTLPED